jgi:hypothetical protein
MGKVCPTKNEWYVHSTKARGSKEFWRSCTDVCRKVEHLRLRWAKELDLYNKIVLFKKLM